MVNKAEELIARGEEVHFDYDSSGKSDRDYRENQALLSLHQMASGSGDDGDFDSSNGGYCGRASRRGASTLAMLTSDVQRLGLGGDVVLLSAQVKGWAQKHRVHWSSMPAACYFILLAAFSEYHDVNMHSSNTSCLYIGENTCIGSLVLY